MINTRLLALLWYYIIIWSVAYNGLKMTIKSIIKIIFGKIYCPTKVQPVVRSPCRLCSHVTWQSWTGGPKILHIMLLFSLNNLIFCLDGKRSPLSLYLRPSTSVTLVKKEHQKKIIIPNFQTFAYHAPNMWLTVLLSQ